MSIGFKNPMSKETMEEFNKIFDGKIAAMDERTVLLNSIASIDSRLMKEIANKENQPVTVEVNEIGSVKMIGDTAYEVRADGWRKIDHA